MVFWKQILLRSTFVLIMVMDFCQIGYSCDTSPNVSCATSATTILDIGKTSCIEGCNVDSQPFMTDRIDGGCQASAFGSIWYTLPSQNTKTLLSATLYSFDINKITVSIYSGDCADPKYVACQLGDGGFLDLTEVKLEAGVDHYIIVSSSDGTEGNFEMCLELDLDESACNINNEFVVNNTSMGSPFTGPFKPGEEVELCYKVTNYNKQTCSFLHGIVPTFGNGWDESSFDANGQPLNITQRLEAAGTARLGNNAACSISSSGNWSWYEAGIVEYNLFSDNTTGLTLGDQVGAGWFFINSFDPNCFTFEDANCCTIPEDPNSSSGDSNFPSCLGVETLEWNICFELQTRPENSCQGRTDCTVGIKSFSDGETGIFPDNDCNLDVTTYLNLSSSCCKAPNVTNQQQYKVCANESVSILMVNDGQDAGMYWFDESGNFYSGAETGNRLEESGLAPGVHIYQVYVTNGCLSEPFELEIIVESNGVIPEFNYPGTLCEFDEVLTLETISDNGISGFWSSGTIDPSDNVGNSITVRFNPTNTSCATNVDLLIEIKASPVLNLLDQYSVCLGSTFELSSLIVTDLTEGEAAVLSLHTASPADDSNVFVSMEEISEDIELVVLASTEYCQEEYPITIGTYRDQGDQVIVENCSVNGESLIVLDEIKEKIGAEKEQVFYLDFNDFQLGETLTAEEIVVTDFTELFTVVTTAEGCASLQPILVELVNQEDLKLSISGNDKLTCERASITLISDDNIEGAKAYNWYDEKGELISTDPNVELKEPGIYQLKVTDLTSGCEVASDKIEVISEKDIPDMDFLVLPSDKLTCEEPEIVLKVDSDLTEYNVKWIMNGIEYDTDSLVVTEATEVMAQITSVQSGCMGETMLVITDERSMPDLELNPIETITCKNAEITITVAPEAFPSK